MIQYKYVALNLQQEKFTGVFIAENVDELAVELQKQGLFLISAKPFDGQVKQSFFSLRIGGSVKMEEINQFSRQLAIMVNSGISILESLDILKEQKYSTMFKEILLVISDDVRAGMMFSEALERHKKIFPPFFRSMVRIGEQAGKMTVILNSLADYYEHDAQTKRKIKSALSYPLMLFGMTILIAVLMLVFIVPTFKNSLGGMDVEITGITKVIYDLSDFVVANWMYLLSGLVGLVAIIFLFTKFTSRGKYLFDVLKVKAPFIRDITIDMIAARFARAFGLLITSGMEMVEALESSLIVFNNQDVEKRFKKCISDVKQGITLSSTFQKNKIFPQIMNQMISVGERTNSLSNVMNKCFSFFDELADSAIQSVTSKIQPIMLIFMGGVVGILFIAMYSPILSIMQTYMGGA